ncbi:hypothetical protein ILUMI_10254 [Ignelater luminosus]|uniref:WD repeat-containing protein 89 n=1 Tax=Ignelater luminosus TaxID=2038154 RepID=A0A8K0GF56_IGNLU|nr:hypothetical protein ILUMI_10254 [Ignelater luminosus]
MVHHPIKKLDLQDSDSDTCDSDALDGVFNTKYQLLAEKQVVSDESYILHIHGTGNADFKVAIGATNNLCEIYHFDNNHLLKSETLGILSNTIVGVQFCPDNNNLLYTASSDANVRLWDLRLSDKLVAQFSDTTIKESQNCRQIISFDISSNNRLVAAGTELFEGESFILFWDIRNVKLLGGYWESHTDDVTQVKFNAEDVNLLMSGSTDGLINIYDLKQPNEDDALMDSFNTESSVEQLLWYSRKGKSCICCTTHTADVQLWQTDAVEPYAHFRRCDIAKEIRRKSEDHCYLVSAHNYINDELFILAGSNENDGECSRAVRTEGKKLIPSFNLKQNKQRVRSSWYNQHHNILVTGGENGTLDVWHIDHDKNFS